MQITELFQNFVTAAPAISARQLSGGRVNDTYLVTMADGGVNVLQRVNTRVPINPEEAAANTGAVMSWLRTRPGLLRFPEFFAAKTGGYLYRDANQDCWRAYRYIDGAPPLHGGPYSPAQLGRAVGAFHRMLADFPVENLYASTPDYHNTPRRFDVFYAALQKAPDDRIASARKEIEFILDQRSTCAALLDIGAPARVTHGDTRLENLLVDPNTLQPVCFIDYDNLMPGVFAFDFGDGARSCCKDCPTDERDLGRVTFRLDYFDVYARDYISLARDILDGTEAVSLAMGAVVMSLELGIRYLTEYVLGENIYFQTEYPAQNLDRARVQLLMCLQMQKAYPKMVETVRRYLTS